MKPKVNRKAPVSWASMVTAKNKETSLTGSKLSVFPRGRDSAMNPEGPAVAASVWLSVSSHGCYRLKLLSMAHLNSVRPKTRRSNKYTNQNHQQNIKPTRQLGKRQTSLLLITRVWAIATKYSFAAFKICFMFKWSFWKIYYVFHSKPRF